MREQRRKTTFYGVCFSEVRPYKLTDVLNATDVFNVFNEASVSQTLTTRLVTQALSTEYRSTLTLQ